MRDALTENIKTLESKLITAVNESNLPPIIVGMMLTNLLYEVNNIRREQEEKEIPEYELEIPSSGNTDEQ